MKEKNISGNYAKLEEYHVQKVINISNEVGFSYIVWQEVFDNGVQVIIFKKSIFTSISYLSFFQLCLILFCNKFSAKR